MKRYEIYPFYDSASAEEEHDGQWVKHDDIEPLLLAIKKLMECKGRYHTEQNFKALADEWEKLQ